MSEPPAPPSTELLAGDYHLDAEIARGGYGVVYRARHARTGEPAAVKVLHADLFGDPSSRARFHREAELLLSLSHPGIVRLHQCGQLDDGRPFIAMELLAGESLAERLARDGRMGAPATIEILAPLAAALDAVHAKGIVHRDIKPSNAFLAGDRVVLLDFGIAKLLAPEGPALTTSRASIGTIPFMSPEQIRGDVVDARADVYSVAALAYTMLTGDAPFGLRLFDVLRQIHLHARPRPPSAVAPVPPALDAPILAALSRDPAARPSSASELVDSLSAALERAPVSRPSRPEGAGERPALAVFVEMRPEPAALASGDERLFEILETGLSGARAELARLGLVALKETAHALLMVRPGPAEGALDGAALDACIQWYRGIAGAARGLVEIGVAVHRGALHAGEGGALLPSGLLDEGSWAPRGLRGVAASRDVDAAAEGEGEVVPGGALGGPPFVVRCPGP